MPNLRSKLPGFTIVELLIVVVVIAILAAISLVVYSGMQERAQNAKTVSAVHEWAQAIKMYKVDHGDYPTTTSCLGANYGRGFSGTEATGGECRQDNAGSAFYVNATFMNLMSDYIKDSPTPAFVTAGSASYPYYRGAYFHAGYLGSKDRIDFVLAGASTQCPAIAGLTNTERTSYPATNSVRCTGRFIDSKW